MMKTLLLRGGISSGLPASPPDPTAYPTRDSTVLYDEQRLHLERLKVKAGDRAAKARLPKFLADKQRIDDKSNDTGTWEAHLPTYARHSSPKKPSSAGGAPESPLGPAPSLAPPDPLSAKRTAVASILTQITASGGLGKALTGSSCYEPKVHKARCALCMMFFGKESMKGVISMKSVMELQASWGLEHKSKRYDAASFLYKKVPLCRFCTQQFSTSVRQKRKLKANQRRDPTQLDKDVGNQITILSNIRLATLIHARELSEIKDRNLAVGGIAAQSSTVDGKLPTSAISGKLGAAPAEECTRTRREFEAWWEVTLDTTYPVKAIVIYTRKDPTGSKQASYKLPPFWVFLTKSPMGTKRLPEVKRLAIAAACVYTDDEKVVWKLPPNSEGMNVRVQVEGIKSLQLAQVEILKGGLTLKEGEEKKEEGQPGGLSMATTTFAFDFIGRPKLKSTTSTVGGTSRPGTAPAKNGLASLSSPVTTRPRTSGGSRNRAPPPPKPSVSDLFESTNAAYEHRTVDDEKMDAILAGFHQNEVEALMRNFLHFAEAPTEDIPRRTEHTAEYSKVFEDLLDRNRLNADQCARAVVALKAGGSSGPRARPKAQFGMWEKDDADAHHGLDDASAFVASHVASPSYVQLVESYAVDDLAHALHDVQYARDIKGLAKPRISWFDFVHVVSCCMQRNLQMLGKVFNVSKDLIGKRTEGMGGGGGDDGEPQDGEGSPSPIRTRAASPSLFATGQTFGTDSLFSNTGGGGGTKKEQPPLSLSQSLKFYDNPSATYADSPAPLRRPKVTRTGKSKLQRSEETYSDMLARMGAEIDPNLTGMEYVQEQERRHNRMIEIHKKVEPPTVSPALNRRNCSLCLRSFPMDAIVSSVTVKNLKNLSKKWAVEFQKFGGGISESALLMQHRIPVCAFCSQFFDPDSLSGISSYKRKKRKNYESYYDDAYPKLFSNVDIPDLRKEFVVAARQKTHMAILNKMEEVEGLLNGNEDYDSAEKIRVSETNSLITTNSRDSHARAINEWSDAVEEQGGKLEAYNPTKLTLRQQSTLGSISLDEPNEPRTNRRTRTTDEIEADDAQYMKSHTDKVAKTKNMYNSPSQTKDTVGNLLRGTVRDGGGKGRKVASTGISLFEFSSQQEKERGEKMIRGSSPVGGMETDEEEEEDYSLDQPSMDSMHSPTSITVMWKPPGDE